MTSQIPMPPPGSIESVALALAAIASLVALGRKVFPRRLPEPGRYVERNEFHAELNALRDKIDARFLNVAEKLDGLKADLLSAADQRSSALHRRINDLESGLARVDERTKRK
jgi:hypothetical protein